MDEVLKFKFKPHSDLDREHQAYEHFKLLWMLSHGYTLYDFINQIEKLMAEFCEDFDESLENFEDNVGFSGSIWPGFDEFMHCEYHQCGYDKEDS